MNEYEQGRQQGLLDRAYDIEHNGGAYNEVTLADQSSWALGYRDGYMSD